MTNILVVDDDMIIRALLRERLSINGFGVLTAASVPEMDRHLADASVDLIMLDVMMPGGDGLSACARATRSGGPPVILLSAFSADELRIRGHEYGAARCLSKACSPRQLIAEVRTVLACPNGAELPPHLAFDGWVLNLQTRELIDPEGILVCLTHREFFLLRTLMEGVCGLIRPHDTPVIGSLAIEPASDIKIIDGEVDVHVHRFRRKLRCPSDEPVQTICGGEYMLVPRVTVA